MNIYMNIKYEVRNETHLGKLYPIREEQCVRERKCELSKKKQNRGNKNTQTLLKS